MDAQVFKDISKGANYATLVATGGVPGALAAGTGLVASVGSAFTDSSVLNEALKFGSQKGAEKFFTEVLGHTPGAAARAVALIDLSGGWDAFTNRVKVEILGIQSEKKGDAK